MASYALKLCASDQQTITVPLFEDVRHRQELKKIIAESSQNNQIFSDRSYEFILECEDITAVRNVDVYINDVFEVSTYHNGQISFPSTGTDDRKIFMDCYGFVKLSLMLTLLDKTRLHLSSVYLPVLVLHDKFNQSVKEMVDYVYEHQEFLSLNGEEKVQNLDELKANGDKSLQTQLLILEEIAVIYESSYAYFRANSRFQIEKVAKIDRLERLQSVSVATLQYITAHPEQLRPVNSNTGIRIRNRVYQPQKVLSLHNTYSYDIYENRVVLGFLRSMIDAVDQLRQECKDLIEQIPSDENYDKDYLYSSFFMFSNAKDILKSGIQKLSRLYDKFIQLWGMYRGVLKIQPEQVITMPKPTAVFISVPQYHKIFVKIYQWFHFGLYDFSKESFMLSFIKVSYLYESYVFIKLTSYLKDQGYLLQRAERCIYPSPNTVQWKYENTKHCNTFVFSNHEHQIKLYYQPVIYDTDHRAVNGIGLYRNNSISPCTSLEDENFGGRYYVPDYLIEIENDGTKKYMILDAKFSKLSTVKSYYLKDLAFKYLFSISPIRNEDTLCGMCIIYGKPNEEEQMQSAYDNQLANHSITPFAEIFPLMEGISSDSQYHKFDLLFQKMFE